MLYFYVANKSSLFLILILDKMKDSIIAKIASRAEELYSETLKLMQKETVQHLWDKVSNVFGRFNFFFVVVVLIDFISGLINKIYICMCVCMCVALRIQSTKMS